MDELLGSLLAWFFSIDIGNSRVSASHTRLLVRVQRIAVFFVESQDNGRPSAKQELYEILICS